MAGVKSVTSNLNCFGALALTMFLTVALPLSASAQSVASLEGQPLRAYPRLILVNQSPLLNLYWANNIKCTAEPANCDRRVDQSAAVRIQKQIERSVKLKIEDFDQYAGRLLPLWRSKFRTRLFPLSIQIQLGEEMYHAGSIFGEVTEQVVASNGSALGPVKLKSRISIGSQNPSLASVDTLIMHEFGHMLLRALEFPHLESAKSGRADSLLEEALPDFISSVTNGGTSAIAPGLQDSASRMIRAKLLDSKTELFMKAKMEMDLRGISHVALRDFSNPYRYSDLYLLPGAYNSSLTFNSMFIKLGPAFGDGFLKNTVLRAIVERPGILNQADASVVLKNLVEFFAEIYPHQFEKQAPAIRKVVRESDWIPALRTSNALQLKSSVDTEDSINVRIFPEFHVDSLFPTKMRSVTYNVSIAGRPRFAFSNFLDYDSTRYLRFLPIKTCEASSVLCVCGQEKNLISIDAIYLSSKRKIESTQRAGLKLSSPKEPPCYIMSFEWEDK